MKRIMIVVETPNRLSIIAYDYDNMESREYVIDLKHEIDPLKALRDIEYSLRVKGYDTRIISRYLKRKEKELRRRAKRHGKL